MPRLVSSPRRRSTRASAINGSPVASTVAAQAARPAQLRASNSKLLLRLLRAHSPCSKADLVRMSGLTAPTVSLVTGHLIENGLVEEIGEGASSGGRPPAMLRFNGQYGYVAGVDLGGTRIRMMLADLNGKPVAEWQTQLLERQKTPRGIVALVSDGLDAMQKEAGTRDRVLHLTAGAPGITDVRRGVVLAAPNLTAWDNVPLRSLLERELSIPVEIENDTNLAAVGEHAGGAAQGVNDFVFLAMGTGVGAGIFLRGALHHGADWSAGEVGYLPVEGVPRRRVQMREAGQLESIIGGLGIEARWQERLKKERRSMQDEWKSLRASEIFDLAEQGNTRAEDVLRHTARILADALSIISLLYNPELIILGGGVGSHRALRAETERCLLQNEFALPTLRSSSLGTQAQLFGAVSVSLTAAEQKLLS